MCCKMAILIFFLDPNWPFYKGYSLCTGYSLCKMADFQNGLISRIFGVFSSGFLHRTTLVCLLICFSHFFRHFNFWPKLISRTFFKGYCLCMGYSLRKMADFQNRLISRIFGVPSSSFLHRKTLVCLYICFSHVFAHFNFWPKLTILQRL